MKRDGTDEWTVQELNFVDQGLNIDAIKSYRVRTGCSLLDAKRSWERVKAGIDPASTRPCGYCDRKGYLMAVNPAGPPINEVTVPELLKKLAAIAEGPHHGCCQDTPDTTCRHDRAGVAIVAINDALAHLAPEEPL